MIAARIPREEEIFEALKDMGFAPTGEKTDTGEFWKHEKSDRSIQVPDSIQGYMPDWLLLTFWAKAAEVSEVKDVPMPNGFNMPLLRKRRKQKPSGI